MKLLCLVRETGSIMLHKILYMFKIQVCGLKRIIHDYALCTSIPSFTHNIFILLPMSHDLPIELHLRFPQLHPLTGRPFSDDLVLHLNGLNSDLSFFKNLVFKKPIWRSGFKKYLVNPNCCFYRCFSVSSP